MLVITIIYSFLCQYVLDKRNYLEQLEYAPLLGAPMCFSLLCLLPGMPSPLSLSQNPNCVFSGPNSNVAGAAETFPHPSHWDFIDLSWDTDFWLCAKTSLSFFLPKEPLSLLQVTCKPEQSHIRHLLP